jgi:LysM repeat protein
MKVEGQTSSDLPTSLILAASVIITVLVALFLALSDDLQTRLPVPIRPTALVQSDVEVVNTLPPASATPTPTTEATTPAGQTATPTTSAIIIVLSCNNRPSDWQAYLVGPNDTLSSLSIRYGATIEEIVLANCLETNAVLSGMTIYLPITFPIRERCGPPPGWRSYTVRRGETLFILARRHGTTVYARRACSALPVASQADNAASSA